MKTIHFVGIGGIGMSALARYMLEDGWTVSGSDRTDSQLIRQLVLSGAVVHIGHNADNVPEQCQLVVYTSAVAGDNAELMCARARGITVILREQLLGQIFNSYRQRIAVCGTHGKTTTTAMLDYVLRYIGIRHSAFIGGIPQDTHSNFVGGGNVVVAEACEYRESFLHLFPSVVVALNVEWDHPDYYKNIQHMQDAYVRFFSNMDSGGTVVAHQSISPSLLCGRAYVTYGQDKGCMYRAVGLEQQCGIYCYTLEVGSTSICTVSLSVVGRHNVDNSLAVIATCALLGIDITLVVEALASFVGAERRWTCVPCPYTNIVEDYAHHPTEISAVLDSAQLLDYDRVILIFQPHTYSRTQALWRQFVSVLSRANIVALLPIYSAREQPIQGISSSLMARAINVYTNSTAYSLDDMSQAYDFVLATATNNDLVLIVGAGDISVLSDMLSQ